MRDINSNIMDFSSYCMERIGHLMLNESTGLPLPESNTGDFPLVAVVCTALTDDGDFVSNILIPILLIVSLVML